MNRYGTLLRRTAAVLLIIALTMAGFSAAAEETLADEQARIRNAMLALLGEEKTFQYKGEEYPVIDGINIANETFWETDDYYPFCDANLAAYLAYSAEMGALFLEYVDVLNRIAVAEGYANYKEYADQALYDYDFDTSSVLDIVRENYPRSVPMLLDLGYYDDLSCEEASLSQEEYISGQIALYGEMSPDFAAPLQELILSPRFTVSKMEKSFAYGGVMFSGSQSTLHIGYYDDTSFAVTAAHEMGHYLNAVIAEDSNDALPIMETHSKGGSLLSLDYARERFRETVGDEWAALYTIQYIMIELAYIYQGAVQYQLLSDIFLHPEEYTPESIGEKYLEYMLSLGYDGGFSPAYQMYVGCEWCASHILLDTPLYTLSYCISAANAIKLWRDEETDGTGVETYVRLIHSRMLPDEAYSDYCRRMGILDFFAPGAHEGLDDFLADTLSEYCRVVFGE